MKAFTLKFALIFILACGFFVHCSRADKLDFEALTKSLRALISDRQTTYADLQDAISRLGKVTEPTSFWTSIINDSSYSLKHRRSCIKALLDRHRPSTIYHLAAVLNKPTWLRDEHIKTIDYIIGYMPVELTPDDTVFVIHCIPGSAPDDTPLFVYLRVGGKVSREEFSRVVRSDLIPLPLPPTAGRPIFQYGFSR